MSPEKLLGCSVRDGVLVPHFLTDADHPWLRALLDEYARSCGRPRRELEQRLAEPLPFASPDTKRRLACGVLDGLFTTRALSKVEPRRARAALFASSAASPERDRAWHVATVSRELAVTADELESALFADVPSERRLVEPSRPPHPAELALRANLALAQRLLFRSTRLRIEMEGNSRAIVRLAKLGGLLCSVDAAAAATGSEGAVLEVSGPLALFRHTLLYGRRLASLLPGLAWCRRFRLAAEVAVGARRLVLRLATGDPLFPAEEPRRYDSKLEERFAREFMRAAPEWHLVREPEPLRAGRSLVFPDFALTHREDPSRRWLVEIAGFWTPGYVATKLARLREANVANLILCLDEERDCGDGALPDGARLVRYRRKIDVATVVAIVGR